MTLVSRTASSIIFLVLARILDPGDFGVVAIAMMAIGFSQILWDAGLNKAIVQLGGSEDLPIAADVAFWTNVVLGIAVYTALYCGAPLLAEFFGAPAAEHVLRVLGLHIVIMSLASVQQALFVRDLDFGLLFLGRLAFTLVPGLFSIPLAMVGHGPWALVAGTLAGSATNLILLWSKSSWRPRFQFDWLVAKRLWGFGFWVLGEGLAGWFLVWGDALVLGKFLGASELGVYRVGVSVVGIIFGLTLNPLLSVLYPTFATLQQDRHTLQTLFIRTNKVVFALALPMGVGLFLTGSELANTLLGVNWSGVGLVVSFLGLTHGIGWLVGVNPEVYRAVGRPDVNTKALALLTAYYLPAYAWAAPLGLNAFVGVRLALALVSIPVHVWISVRLLAVSPWYMWHQGRSVIRSALAMVVIVVPLHRSLSGSVATLPDAVLLAVLVTLGTVVYLSALWLQDRAFLRETLGLARRAAGV